MEIMTDLDNIKEELDEKIFNDVVAKPKASEWIPVTKRLPEKNGRYLVTNTKWGEWETTIDFFYNGDWIGDVKPIAWMPLLDPYREDGEA